MEVLYRSNVVGYPNLTKGVTWVSSKWTLVWVEIFQKGNKFVVMWRHTEHDGKPNLRCIDLLMKIRNQEGGGNTTKHLCDTFEDAKSKVGDVLADRNMRVVRSKPGYQVLFFAFDIENIHVRIKEFADKYK